MMSKQELLDKITGYSSFVKSFFDEYKDEWIYEKGERLTNLFEEIAQTIKNDSIQDFLFERISKLVDTLDINALQQLIKTNNNIHDFKIYKEASDNIIVNSLFVEKTFCLLKAIGFANSNVVLIGANGSGKTTFANSIREKLEKTDNGIVIPAQKILIFPTYDYIPTYKSAYATYQNREKDTLDDKQTYNASKSDDIPYNLINQYGAEIRILVSALLGERIARRDGYCSNIQDGDIVDTKSFRSKLDEVFEIWNNLIEHRILYCNSSGNLQIRYSEENSKETKEYPAYKMSDGEREIFYVVGRVLLAKESSLVVIDEPELHLHKSIMNKLWDTLEQKRNDCMFIYLTHDIDFASTRIAKKCWLKSYTADVFESWEVEPITDNDIPEPLLMKLLGSRKRILFCEGRNNSLDCNIFEILFPNYTITPVTSCKDVINYTRAFNKISNRYSEAFGIIDRDFRCKKQLDKLKTENIFSYDVAEVENLFLSEDFIKGFAEYKREVCNIDEIKTRIFELFNNNIQQQVSLYVSQKIDYYFKEANMKKGNNNSEVKRMFLDFIDDIKIDEWFTERTKELEDVISNKNYEHAIMLYNNKGLHSVIEKYFGISSYNQKSIAYLKKSEEAQKVLRKFFPLEI